MTDDFKKRFFSRPGDFIRESRRIGKHVKTVKKIRSTHELDKRLREKIMLAVCTVNKCRNCSYLHTKTTLESGVSDAEIKQLLKGELGDFPEEEAAALAYAQHIAEYGDQASPKAREEAVAHYGPEKTLLIEHYAMRVHIGNMICNTVEARSVKATPTSGRFLFFLVYLMCAPIACIIRRQGEKGRKFLSDNEIAIP